jgi:hypothetical protein
MQDIVLLLLHLLLIRTEVQGFGIKLSCRIQSTLDGRHWGFDNDGDYDWEDYQNRDWQLTVGCDVKRGESLDSLSPLFYCGATFFVSDFTASISVMVSLADKFLPLYFSLSVRKRILYSTLVLSAGSHAPYLAAYTADAAIETPISVPDS